MIDFTRAFSTAWERMEIILFRPFDLGKWFIIGFSAFLAGLLDGGNGYNGGYDNPADSQQNGHQHTWWQLPSHGTSHEVVQAGGLGTPHLAMEGSLPSFDIAHFATSYLASLSIVFAVFAVLFVFLVVIALYWLGARGQFLFLDNIVRNRGAITWPWTTYARQGNSLFFFILLYLLVLLVVFVPLIVLGMYVGKPLFQNPHTLDLGTEVLLTVLAVVALVILVTFSVIFFLFMEFGVTLMFRHGLMARPAFMATMRLMRDWPGSITIFVLLRIALWLAVVIVSLAACCLTCCLAAVPYLGTVILLPALIFVRCFSLDCLAQFGAEYNVWTVDVPPGGPAAPPSFSPPRPLG